MEDKQKQIQDEKVIAENEVILKAVLKGSERHVKEEQEPVLKDIIYKFNYDYAVKVASKSSIEIIKSV